MLDVLIRGGTVFDGLRSDPAVVDVAISDGKVVEIGHVTGSACYALWSVQAGRDNALNDAFALRLAAVEAADTVFRVAHQLHGAIGFCDETPLSWVSRYSQPLRRLPFGLSATREALTCRLGQARPHRAVQRDVVTYDLPEELAVEDDGAVRTVLINRPAELNAVNQRLHWALANVWRQLAADRQAKVVILTGAGRTFCAGGDFDWITSFLDDPVARDESLREGAQIIEEMLRFPLPVIAAVNGAAVGLGCSLAVLCDIVLISQTAHLADPHVTVGLVAGDGGAAFWPLLTPILRSREYLYTGDRIPAATAVELGLATRTVAPQDLLGEARDLAHRLAGQPAEALSGTKRVLNMHLSRALSGAMQAGFAAEAVTMRSAEHRERLLAVRERARQR